MAEQQQREAEREQVEEEEEERGVASLEWHAARWIACHLQKTC